MSTAGLARRQRGVALLLTLWALAALSLLMLEIITTVRLENRQSLYQLQQARADLAAEAGLALAVLHLSDPQQASRWGATGQPYTQAFEGSQLTVSVRSDAGKVDLNSASPALCAHLARLLGASASEAAQLDAGLRARQAQAEVTPLQVLEQALQVPGMSEALFQRLQPYLTVWTDYDEPVAALAAPPVQLVLGQGPAASDSVDPGPVLSITSQATLDNGTRATLNATVLITLDGGAKAFRVLRWQP